MSEESVSRFLALLSEDPVLDQECQRACAAAGSAGEALGGVVAVASRHGMSFTAQEIVGQLVALRAAPDELDDDELDAVAGGGVVIEDRPPFLASRAVRELRSSYGPELFGSPAGQGLAGR